MGILLDTVRADVRADRDRWLTQLGKLASTDRLGQLRDDDAFETFAPILILGPTGSGKQGLAQFIANDWNGASIAARVHEISSNAGDISKRPPNWLLDATERVLEGAVATFLDGGQLEGPRLHTFNIVGANTLIDPELFGVAKGAATTVDSAPGAFHLAGPGVLFLDELLELDLQLQSKLLMVLQNGRIMPVRAGRSYPFVCRVVAATNRAEDAMALRRVMDRKEVRRDLVARFARQYAMPSLSQRPLEIIPILMMLLKERHSVEAGATGSLHLRISKLAFEALISHHFPENIRNLQQLSGVLPREVISSEPFAGSSHDLPLCSIQLCNLRVLEGSTPDDAAKDVRDERDFYEFALSYPLPPEDEVPDAPAESAPAEREETASQPMLSEFAAKLADVTFPKTPEIKPVSANLMARFLTRPGIAESVARLVQTAIEAHCASRPALNATVLRDLFASSRDLPQRMPLHGVWRSHFGGGAETRTLSDRQKKLLMAWERDLTEWINDYVAMNAGCPEPWRYRSENCTDCAKREGQTRCFYSGRRLHQNIILSLLLGHVVQPGKKP
jgi:DNA-binding NtrC family response regulator